MTRKERLLRTLRGEPVDRPPVNLLMINGVQQNPADPDRYNIFNDPSWKPVIDLAANASDRIVMHGPKFAQTERERRTVSSSYEQGDSTFTEYRLETPKALLTRRTRRDKDLNTVWEIEDLIKDTDDVHAYLSLPETQDPAAGLDVSAILRSDELLGDTGLAALDISDALCVTAALFSMADYLVFALTERELFTQLLDRAHREILARVKAISKALPGRLYRLVGSEYAAPPYLPPELFREYVVKYDRELIDVIHDSGGFVRVHSHGRLSQIIGDIVDMGADALDPIEPPPQGDVSLRFIREKYGDRIALFGNIELCDIENLDTPAFTQKVQEALDEGMYGNGRGFALTPSAISISRAISPKIARHYEIMAQMAAGALY